MCVVHHPPGDDNVPQADEHGNGQSDDANDENATVANDNIDLDVVRKDVVDVLSCLWWRWPCGARNEVGQGNHRCFDDSDAVDAEDYDDAEDCALSSQKA